MLNNILKYLEQGNKIPCFGLEFDNMEKPLELLMQVYPNCDRDDMMIIMWGCIVDKFCAEVVIASGGRLKLGQCDKNKGVIEVIEDDDYYCYIDNVGDCNCCDWNMGYLQEEFDVFKGYSEVYAPLVFDNGKEFYKFVLMVEKELNVRC